MRRYRIKSFSKPKDSCLCLSNCLLVFYCCFGTAEFCIFIGITTVASSIFTQKNVEK